LKKDARLRLCEKKYAQLARSLADLGFIWHGNLQRRMLPCKNPKCACSATGKPQHGPYPYWTTKVKQKTVTKLLTAEEADLYELWIQNRRKLEATIKQMNDISKKAAKLMLTNRKTLF
jgi:hypothetical protein